MCRSTVAWWVQHWHLAFNCQDIDPGGILYTPTLPPWLTRRHCSGRQGHISKPPVVRILYTLPLSYTPHARIVFSGVGGRWGCITLVLAKRFCRVKFWAKFPFRRGAVRGEVLHEVCDEVFGLILLGYSEQTKTSAKTSALNSHDSAQQNWRNFREKLHDEVLQGDPTEHTRRFGSSMRVEVLLRLCHACQDWGASVAVPGAEPLRHWRWGVPNPLPAWESLDIRARLRGRTYRDRADPKHKFLQTIVGVLSFSWIATPLARYKCLNSQNAQKCLREGAKGAFGPLEWESQNSLLHGAKPRFRVFPPVRNKVCTVRVTLLGRSPQRPQITFSTLP